MADRSPQRRKGTSSGESELRPPKPTISGKTTGPRAENGVPPIVDDVVRTQGQPLDAGARALFEPRFGHDFSRVRVHDDSAGAASARAVDALAYTVGSHIAFATGRYHTRSAAGQKLLAHELAHVVQQRASSSGSQAATVDPAESPLERDADRMAAAATAAPLPPPVPILPRHAAGASVQRQPAPDASATTPRRASSTVEGTQGTSADARSRPTRAAPVHQQVALGLSPEQIQAAAVEVIARVEGAADAGKADVQQTSKQLQWGTLDVPIDKRLLASKNVNRELAIRFFQVVLKRFDVDLDYWMAERIHDRLQWHDLVTDARARELISAELAAHAHLIGYKSNNDSASAVANAYFDIIREDQARLMRAYDELHKVHYAEDAILSFYIAHANGLISVANGILDLPVAPVNFVQSLRGKEHVRFLGRIPKIGYVGDYGRKYGSTMETGVVLGLMLVGARGGGGGGALGLSTAEGSAALSEGAGAAMPWLTRLLGGTRFARPILNVASKLLGVAGVFAGGQAAVDTVKAIQALRTGQIVNEDGTVEPLTEDKAFELLEGILVNVLIAKDTAKGLLSKKAGAKEGEREEESLQEETSPEDLLAKVTSEAVTAKNARAVLEQLKAAEAAGTIPARYAVRKLVLERSGGSISTVEAYTLGPIPTDYAALRAFCSDPSNWLPQRRALQDRLVKGETEKAQALSDRLEPNTAYAIRGNTASGKTTTVARDPALGPRIRDASGEASGVINPDPIKAQLVAEEGGNISTSQAHMEGSILAERVEKAMLDRPGSSLVYDRRFAWPQEIPNLLKSIGNRRVKLVDIDVPLETSAVRVLMREPGTADPLVPFEDVAQGFKGIRKNRAALINGDGQGFAGVKGDARITDYDLYVMDANGESVLVASKHEGAWKPPDTAEKRALFEEATPLGELEIGQAKSTVIDDAFIDRMVAGTKDAASKARLRARLDQYKGKTLGEALDAHANRNTGSEAPSNTKPAGPEN